jgi:hypothetical protein
MTNLDFLLKKGAGVKAWINNPITLHFMEYLKLERESVIRHLRDAEGPQATGRAQGQLEEIEKILSLPNVINDVKSDGGKK